MAVHLVTGAGSGIGRALADLLHGRGDELVLLARSEERAAELVERYAGASTLVADLAAPLPDLAVPERLDTVLHCAGVVDVAAVADADPDAVEEQVRVNLLAPAELTRRCLPALRAARGLAVFVNSTSGLAANPGWAGYAASKFGLRGYADALRAEEAPYGVRVTSVFPSRTATPMQELVHDREGKEYDAGDWMSPETVAQAVVGVLDLPRDATTTDLTLRTHH
jgi:short-subunit dehydrogenase